MVSNKFKVLEDLSEETKDKQSEGKQEDQIAQEIVGTLTQMEEYIIKGKQKKED